MNIVLPPTSRSKKQKTTSADAQQKQNEDTSARVRAVLAQLSNKDYTVLARYAASKGPDHEVRLGSNGAVYCTGRCWQYSKDGTCKHLKHFRKNCVAQKFGRIEKGE